jgi:hypothetical protein
VGREGGGSWCRSSNGGSRMRWSSVLWWEKRQVGRRAVRFGDQSEENGESSDTR